MKFDTGFRLPMFCELINWINTAKCNKGPVHVTNIRNNDKKCETFKMMIMIMMFNDDRQRCLIIGDG